MATHIYHYHVNAEQRYFLGRENIPLFDMISLNGNIVAHTPKAVAAFIATTAKEFYIDPQTHAFQHPTKNLKRDLRTREERKRRLKPIYAFKESIKSLANDFLGGIFSNVISLDSPIMPSRFVDDSGNIKKDIITDTCERVLNFQKTTLQKHIKEDDEDFLDKNVFKPAFLLAPYFYLSHSNFYDWLNINLECYKCSVELEKDIPIYMPLVISRESMELAQESVVDTIRDVKPQGILLWIDENKEEDLTLKQIKKYMEFLVALRNHTNVILNTHGGYLSLLLCHDDLKNLLGGVGHSINYGEHRSVIPVGGGMPMARFYYHTIHSRLKYADALELFLRNKWLSSPDDYRRNICRCRQCEELIRTSHNIDKMFLSYGESDVHPWGESERELPTGDAKKYAARHYLYNKALEFEEVSSSPFKENIAKIIESYNNLQRDSSDSIIGHLYNWHKALSDF